MNDVKDDAVKIKQADAEEQDAEFAAFDHMCDEAVLIALAASPIDLEDIACAALERGLAENPGDPRLLRELARWTRKRGRKRKQTLH